MNMTDNYPNIQYIGFKDENLKTPITFPAQHQNFQPGLEYEMKPLPIFDNPSFFRDSSLKESIHLFPNLYKGEGQFIALLKKDGESIKRIKEPKLEKAKYLKDFNLNFKREIILKDKVYATNNLLNLNIKVLTNFKNII